jgi:glycosyltransferase involved in cell wall biosynthesis
LARIFDGFVFNKILINCLVSFPKTTKILHLVNSLQIRDNAKLIIAVHDYFTVCPSANLLNSSGKFCAIPDMETCRVCLPEHRNGFVSLAGETSVEKWRSAWRTLMKPGTELVCFSTSSLNLLTTAYPEVTGMVNVLPHKPVPLRSVRIPAHPGGAVIVGVIGNISYHKGSQVVADLAKAISAAGAVVRIVVLGTISLHCPPEIVEYTGSYQRDELPDLAERHHINMVLMPSVCPETFSYVTHEVISMGLPLITLNLGAQADAARLYPKGRVSTHSDGPGLLQEILDFDAFINKNME